MFLFEVFIVAIHIFNIMELPSWILKTLIKKEKKSLIYYPKLSRLSTLPPKQFLGSLNPLNN